MVRGRRMRAFLAASALALAGAPAAAPQDMLRFLDLASEEFTKADMTRAEVEAALARARERGCVRMELDVNEKNPAAVALYESLGFESWSDPPGGRNLLMRRRL